MDSTDSGVGGASRTTGQPLTPADDTFVHQTPDPLGFPVHRSHYWRESWFFAVHHPERLDDVLFLTMATYPTRGTMDALQMGNIGGEKVLGVVTRDHDGDPHTTEVGPVRYEVVRPYEEIRLVADADACEIGFDLTFRARTKAYGLRRGSLRTADAVVWDQSHLLQAGSWTGSYTRHGETRSVDGWWGQRDHSWGVRDHGRCPLWIWFQIQLPDGMLGVWHWETEQGARIYTDGCWAPADGADPVPVVDFATDVAWVGADGAPAVYGEHGDDVTGVAGRSTFTLADGRTVVVDAEGRFDRPYEPFHRGGLNQVLVTTTDGRTGSAIYEITGARHRTWFPDAVVAAQLPS